MTDPRFDPILPPVEPPRSPAPRPDSPPPLVTPSRPRVAPRRGRWGVTLGLLALVVLVTAVVAARRGWLAGDDGLRLAGNSADLAGSRVAVLPVVNATGDAGQSWVSRGLTGMISELLLVTQGVETVAPRRLARQIDTRRLARGDAERAHLRRLARDLGATLTLEAVLRRAPAGYVLDFTLHDEQGETARGMVEGETVPPLAARLARAVARLVSPDALPVEMARVFTGDPFLDQLYGMGLAVLEAGDAAAAKDYFAIALRHRPGFLRARSQLGRAVARRGDVAAGRKHHLEVLAGAQGHGDRALQAATLLALGELAAVDGRAAEADELLRQAAAVYDSLEQRAGRVAVLAARARIALGERRDEAAAALFAELLEQQRAAGDLLGQAGTLRQLGTLSLSAGALEQAAAHLDQARELARRTGDTAAEMHAVASLGELARRRGEAELADTRWAEALVFYRQQKDRRRTLLLTRKRAELAASRGELATAEKLYHDAVELARELKQPAAEARASLQLARILLQAGYPYQARPHLDRALELGDHLDDPALTQRVIARLAYERGDYRLAVDSQRSARGLAGDDWSAVDAAFLRVYERARVTGVKQPLPAGAAGG